MAGNRETGAPKSDSSATAHGRYQTPPRGPIRLSLLAKAREAALTAVQTYNNPLVKFKSESYIVLMTIAWTYLLHAHYARQGVDIRHAEKDPRSARRYARNPDGGFRWWDLAMCINQRAVHSMAAP